MRYCWRHCANARTYTLAFAGPDREVALVGLHAPLSKRPARLALRHAASAGQRHGANTRHGVGRGLHDAL